MTRVVVFDLDDTLYLERDFVRSGFAAVGAWLRTHHGVSDFEAHAWELFLMGRRGDVFDRALPELGLDPQPKLVRRLVRVYREHLPSIRLEPATADLLAALCGRCRVAVLTDGYHETQRRKIAALALEPRCRPIVYTDRWGRAHWKPSPRGFLHVQRALEAAPERCIYIGDNPAKDFRAPKALGWRTLRVRHALGEHARAAARSPLDEADATVDSLAEVSAADLLQPDG
jgi:putative hydrolase of the HAD superfamily